MLAVNKYSRWYIDLCRSRQELNGCLRKQGFELHHITPRALGGTNAAENLVALTSREHFVAHRLLCRSLIDGDDRRRMNSALALMGARGAIRNGRAYELVRIGREGKPSGHGANVSAATKGRPKPWLKGRKRPDHAALLRGRKNPEHSARLTGRKRPEHAAKLRGVPRPPHVVEACRAANLGRPKAKLTCPHCGKVGGAGNMQRWHFANCPSR